MIFALVLLIANVSVEPDDAGWRRLLPDREDINNFEYHSASIERSGELVRVWSRNDILSHVSGTARFVREGRNFWLSELDCRRGLIRHVGGIRRILHGDPISQQDEAEQEFSPVADGSIGGYLQGVACPAGPD